MTTLPAYAERTAARALTVDWRKLLLVALLAVPFTLGYTVRVIVRTVGWLLAYGWAATVEGYQAAAGAAESGRGG